MKPKFFLLSCVLASSLIAAGARAEITPAARALADSTAAALGAARTLQVTATHKVDASLCSHGQVNKAPLHITVQRPNQCFVSQPRGQQSRELSYDGRTLCVLYPVLKLHALSRLRAGSIDEFADQMDARHGFRPPVAELLSADFAAQIFRDVTTAKVTGTERVGWTNCERLHFEQEGMTGDLWVGKEDRLPRRYLLTFTFLQGSPTWDIRLKDWKLNGPVDASLFSKRPAPDSREVPMLKSR